jgi:hypothetical protein
MLGGGGEPAHRLQGPAGHQQPEAGGEPDTAERDGAEHPEEVAQRAVDVCERPGDLQNVAAWQLRVEDTHVHPLHGPVLERHRLVRRLDRGRRRLDRQLTGGAQGCDDMASRRHELSDTRDVAELARRKCDAHAVLGRPRRDLLQQRAAPYIGRRRLVGEEPPRLVRAQRVIHLAAEVAAHDDVDDGGRDRNRHRDCNRREQCEPLADRHRTATSLST